MTTTISKTERCDPDASRRAAKTIVQVWGSFDARTVAPVHRGGGSESRTPRTTAGLGRIAVEALSRSGSESLYASSSSSRTEHGCWKVFEGSRRTVTTRNRFSPRVGTGVSGSSFRASRMHISSQASVRSAPIVRMDGADRSGEQLKFFWLMAGSRGRLG